MSTTGTEKHCRLCLMLNKGGTKACHSLLLKRVEELSPSDHQPYPWTVHEFLQSKKKEMLKSNISKEKIQVLFPRTGVTDLAKWDLSLFCTILITYCGLKQLTRLDVERLRTLRNELCHMNDLNIDDVIYNDNFETIKVVVTRILESANDNETKRAIERILNDIHEGPLSIGETLKEMRTFYLMEWDIREKLEELKDVEERVLQKVEMVDHKLDHIIDKKLDHSARNNVLLPGVEVLIDIKNLSTDEEQQMSVVLEQLFEEVIHEDDEFISKIPVDSYNNLREAVRKTFKLFLSKGWRITSVKPKCIQLHVRCLTFKSLAALFREHVQGQINEALTDLNVAISKTMCRKETQLETVIYKQEFWAVMGKTMSVVDEFLSDLYSDFDTTLNEKQQPFDDEKKHSLLITARNISHGGQHSIEKECENELDTCLRLLKAELVTELNSPNITVQASYTPEKTQIVSDQASSKDEKMTTSKEQEIYKYAHVEEDRKQELDTYSRLSRTEQGTNVDPLRDSMHASYTSDKYLSSASKPMSADVESLLQEHQSKSSVDSERRDKLQTIALLEIYKSQRAIGHYFELAYLSLCDQPDIAKEVFAASQSAGEKHQKAADTKWCYLVGELCWVLKNPTTYDISEVDSVIEIACRLKTCTEELQNSYIELQDIIRNLIKRCENSTSLRKHKEAKARDKKSIRSEEERAIESMRESYDLQSKVNLETSRRLKHLTKEEKKKQMIYDDSLSGIRRMMIDKDASSIYSGSYKFVPKEDVKTDTFVRDKHTEIAKYSIKHYTGKPEMKIFKHEDWTTKWNVVSPGLKTLKFYESLREKETLLTMLRPGSALTGGISSRAVIEPYEIFESVRYGEELEVFENALHKSQEDTETAIERERFVRRMHIQRKDALKRLETIIKGEDGDSGIECLREVEKHLKYINIQFGRINGCWSEVISALRLLKTKGLLLSSYRWTGTEQEEWEFVEKLFLYYCSERDEIDIFRFLRESRTADPAQRRQDLFLVIGKEISGTYLSPDSGESSDQHKNTDVKGKAQLFPGEEISGTYLPPDSGKSSYQRKDTDVKDKAKLYPGEEIPKKSKCTIL